MADCRGGTMRERSARSAKPARDRRRKGARYWLPTEISPERRRELTQHWCRSSIISGGQRHPGNPGLNLPKEKGAHCADRHPVSKRSQSGLDLRAAPPDGQQGRVSDANRRLPVLSQQWQPGLD
jgi:hypothetical protein